MSVFLSSFRNRSCLKETGISREDLKSRGRAAGERKMLAIELLCRFSDVTQRGLVKHCGYKHEWNVGWQRRMLTRRLQNDPAFARKFALLEKRLKNCFNISY